MTITCVSCKNDFTWGESEQELYARIGLQRPKRCAGCRKRERRYVDTDAIVAFVQKVEDTKGFRRDVRLVFAHMVEEVGELSRAVWDHEKAALGQDYPDPSGVGRELIDVVFLACWLADILRIDLNKQVPARMAEIRTQYGIK